MQAPELKPLIWIGGSKKDLGKLPRLVRKLFGFALRLAQQGLRHVDAKSLRGFGGGAVIEIVGSKTPRADMELIRKRLKDAETHYRNRKRGSDEEKGQSH